MPAPIPITCLIDDPAPGVNPLYYFRLQVDAMERPTQPSGELMPPAIPTDFLREFVETVRQAGMRGKFSVLPFPAGLGSILTGWDGFSAAQCAEWTRIVRENLTADWDITPEVLTHTRVLDLRTLLLGEESEHGWSQTQTEETLTPYVAEALRILREAGLDANGCTSPCDFGIKVEPAYAGAVLNAQREVNRREQTWYFLHVDTKSTAPRSGVSLRDGHGWAVSLASQAGDAFWQSLDSPRSDEPFVHAMADALLTADGAGGRLAELFRAGGPIVFHTHWQCLYSNGRKTGLRALAELGGRVRECWRDQVRWVRCSELAAEIAATATPQKKVADCRDQR